MVLARLCTPQTHDTVVHMAATLVNDRIGDVEIIREIGMLLLKVIPHYVHIAALFSL